jgi:hypothetical protein
VRDGHNCSITVTVDSKRKLKPLESIKFTIQNWRTGNRNFWNNLSGYSDEWYEVVDWVYDNWDSFIGISFLPKYDPELEPYPQMPYEPTNERGYNQLFSSIPSLKEEEFIKLISKYESEYEEFELEASCNTGFCPVR